jgi:hypothetical protein
LHETVPNGTVVQRVDNLKPAHGEGIAKEKKIAREVSMVNRIAEYLPYSLFGVAIIAAILDIALFGGGVVESFLLWLLVIVVGLGSLYAFIGHSFAADDVDGA